MPLREISFDTISGAGANGAIMHYRVSHETNRAHRGRTTLFLLDSGAQYQDGTTDITRTVAIGTPSAEMRDRYTIVLKGMIAHFAAALSRRARAAPTSMPSPAIAHWQAGIDFAHGTGHGVGSFCRCTRVRSALPRPAPRSCSRA